MKTSAERILTTHVGSLPRPDDLLALLSAREDGVAVDMQEFEAVSARAVADIVARQVDCGVDIVNDGEMAKISYATYLKDRVDGFGGTAGKSPAARDLLDYIGYARQLVERGGTEKTLAGVACDGPLSRRGDDLALQADLAHFIAACESSGPHDRFLTAASPGVVSLFLQNQYYPSQDAYLEALAAVLRPEYEAIAATGSVLQLDCPDLAMGRHILHADKSTDDFRKVAARHIEVLNAATSNIPPEQMRIHLCWGNYEGPHHHDIPVADILDLVYGARPQAISVEGANPRHEHEWEVFQEKPLPDDKLIVPGVIDSTSNFIEHPRLVAQRVERYAGVVGRERVIASSDCGFGTFAKRPPVYPDIVWAKLRSLVEGAAIASERMWR